MVPRAETARIAVEPGAVGIDDAMKPVSPGHDAGCSRRIFWTLRGARCSVRGLSHALSPRTPRDSRPWASARNIVSQHIASTARLLAITSHGVSLRIRIESATLAQRR